MHEAQIDQIQILISKIEDKLKYLDDVIIKDHKMAIQWFEDLKEKYEGDELTTEDGSIEREINNAMSNVIGSTDKLPKIIDAISKLLSALVKERALLKISGHQEKQLNIDDPGDRLKLMEKNTIRMLEDTVERSIYQEK